MTYGLRMKVRRKELKINAQQLADKAGVSVSTIFSYENERRIPTLDKMRKIASALDMTLDELFKGENKDESNC